MGRVFAIADLHLSLGDPFKSMEVFEGWDHYVERIEANWKETVGEEDTVVLGGDTSWGLELENARPDFAFLEALPGRKLLLKGNHDYWWTTVKKMNAFFDACGFHSFSILHNNSFQADGFQICGTRGWMIDGDEPADRKVRDREAGRLAASLDSAKGEGEKIVFLHYPPAYGGSVSYNITELLMQRGVERVYYGHIHSKSARRYALQRYEGLMMTLIAADGMDFRPLLVPKSSELGG